MNNRLEVCCGDANSVIAAKNGGAKRIELCSGLTEGGLTPSPGLIRLATEIGFDEINILIRCRKGDFLYNYTEMRIMIEDANMAVQNGATGIVWGGLNRFGEIDLFGLKKMRKACENMNFTFHRAIDVCADPQKALEQIIRAGCTCILTSGMASTAIEGIEMIRQLHEQSKGRIDIMAGSGINSSNCVEILEKTGVSTIHSTAKRRVESKMEFRRTNVSMEEKGADEYSIYETSAEEVKAILEKL